MEFEKLVFKRVNAKPNFAQSMLKLGVFLFLEIMTVIIIFDAFPTNENGFDWGNALLIFGVANIGIILLMLGIYFVEDGYYRINRKMMAYPAMEIEGDNISIYLYKDKGNKRTFNLNEISNIDIFREAVWNKTKPHLTYTKVGRITFKYKHKTFDTGYFELPDNINQLLKLPYQNIEKEQDDYE